MIKKTKIPLWVIVDGGIALFWGFVVALMVYLAVVQQHHYEQKLKDAAIKVQMQRAIAINATQQSAKQEQVIEKLRDTIKTLSAGLAPGWHTAQASITAYSPLDDKNGINSSGDPTKTSIGMKVGPGRFAVDPKRIPYGSRILVVYSDGTVERGIAADTGGALRKPGILKLDVFRKTFKQAQSFGHHDATVIWQVPKTTSK